jgi:RNA polymerase sigma-70 factor (ECF subfamily)
MSLACEGDSEAYADLMHEIARAVEAYLHARFGPNEQLEDCVQEALLAVHRARHTWDPQRPFRPWLFTIVRHKTVDHFRRARVRAGERAAGARIARLPAREGVHPASAVDGARILARLSPEHREALTLTKFAGYSLAEAARETGVSQTAMKTRVHRALRSVRRLLAHEAYEEEVPS